MQIHLCLYTLRMGCTWNVFSKLLLENLLEKWKEHSQTDCHSSILLSHGQHADIPCEGHSPLYLLFSSLQPAAPGV